MSRLPRITGKQLLSALRKAGFVLVRIKGSHHFVRHADGRTTTVPVHTGDIIGPGLISDILRDVEMSREELAQLL